MIPPKSDGTNLIGNITLPNPTALSFEVGTLNLDLLSGDLLIGNATLLGVTLVPGDNTYALTGSLDLKKVIENLGQILHTQLPSLKNGNLSMNARTTSAVWNGTLVPYYTDVLRELTLNTQVGVGDVLRNTLQHFVQSGNVNLTSLIGGVTSRSLDTRESSDANVLATVLKQSKYFQGIFENVDPASRDEMIDTLVSYYPQR